MFRSGLSVLLTAVLCAGTSVAQPGVPGVPRPLRFENSPRVHELIRAGTMYLSLQDALSLAIENNLDIELQRFTLRISDTESPTRR